MLLGILMAAGLGLNLGALCLYLYALVFLRFIAPVPAWRRALGARIDAVIDHAVDVNRWLMNKRLLGEVEVTWQGKERLSRDKWFLLIPNHQSWVDIILLQNLMREHVPALKFFNKQVLIWLPLVGLAMHFLGFPYLKRYSREQIARRPKLKQVDQARMRRAIEIFEKRPTGIMIFAEGTRFTAEKHARQAPPYRHLLNPRSGGVATVLARLGHRLEAVLDVTIVYPDGRPGFWGLLCGRMGAAKFDVRVLSVPGFAAADGLDEDALRQATQDWLAEIWQARDARIRAIMEAR
ncbi:MAG: acetyltransferase [Gammaproteobacteria bacterium]|nr:acetyltransferase [Gammaproteobacteria bacterium]